MRQAGDNSYSLPAARRIYVMRYRYPNLLPSPTRLPRARCIPPRLLAFALLLACVLAAMHLQRAAAQDVSGITSPATGSAVSGDVPIFGTALIEPFQKYELHYKAEPSGDDAFIYFGGNTVPVTNGQLGIWQSGGLQPGAYSLRLRVVKTDGNYAEYFARNLSVNQGAAASVALPDVTATPGAPTPTPIPTATFTPAPQPTAAVGQVEQPALAEPPTPTPAAQVVADAGAALLAEPAAEAGASGSEIAAETGALVESAANSEESAGGSVTRQLGEALSINRLRGAFLNGIRISAALFLGVIAIYGGKRLFDWVWTQFA